MVEATLSLNIGENMSKIKFQTVTIKLTKSEVQNCITSFSLVEYVVKNLAIGEYNTSGFYNDSIEQLKIEWKFNRLWYNFNRWWSLTKKYR